MPKKVRSVADSFDPWADVAEVGEDDAVPVVDDFAQEQEIRQGRRLRRRGPLDESLTQGRYAAVARSEETGEGSLDAAGAEAAMDDLFGMLDEDLDGADGPAFDNEEEFAEYMASTEAKNRRAAKKRPRDAQADDDTAEADTDILSQVRALQEAQQTVLTVHTESTTTSRDASTATELVEAYGRLLSMRLKLQPAVATALRLPQYYAVSDFSADLPAFESETKVAAAELRKYVCDISTAAGCVCAGTDSTQLWTALSKWHKKTMASVDESVRLWGRHARNPRNTKNEVAERPLIELIHGVIGGKARLLQRAQRNRAHASVLGHPLHGSATQEQRALRIAEGDVDEEIFDDADFARELAHRHGGAVAKLASLAAPTMAETGRGEAKKGQHRRTKGRTVNYDPRPKLVGFMVPVPFDESSGALRATLFTD